MHIPYAGAAEKQLCQRSHPIVKSVTTQQPEYQTRAYFRYSCIMNAFLSAFYDLLCSAALGTLKV